MAPSVSRPVLVMLKTPSLICKREIDGNHWDQNACQGTMMIKRRLLLVITIQATLWLVLVSSLSTPYPQRGGEKFQASSSSAPPRPSRKVDERRRQSENKRGEFCWVWLVSLKSWIIVYLITFPWFFLQLIYKLKIVWDPIVVETTALGWDRKYHWWIPCCYDF